MSSLQPQVLLSPAGSQASAVPVIGLDAKLRLHNASLLQVAGKFRGLFRRFSSLCEELFSASEAEERHLSGSLQV